jgi:hypothetical protein
LPLASQAVPTPQPTIAIDASQVMLDFANKLFCAISQT